MQGIIYNDFRKKDQQQKLKRILPHLFPLENSKKEENYTYDLRQIKEKITGRLLFFIFLGKHEDQVVLKSIPVGHGQILPSDFIGIGILNLENKEVEYFSYTKEFFHPKDCHLNENEFDKLFKTFEADIRDDNPPLVPARNKQRK